jgi:hypothetical protein
MKKQGAGGLARLVAGDALTYLREAVVESFHAQTKQLAT